MTEDIPLEITSSDMANLPIFIAVLIVATVVVRVYFSIKHNEKPPIKRGEIRKQAKTLKSSRLWTAGKQVTSE